MMMWPFPDDGSFSDGRRRSSAADDPDVRLTCQLAEALLADVRTRHQRITVEVQNRVVLLSGTVDKRSVKQVARDITREASGVVDICDSLQVTGDDEAGSPLLGDEYRFQGIVADMQANDLPGHPTLGMPRRRVTVAWAILAASAWAFLTVLMVTSQWVGVAVSCLVIGLILMVVNQRRRHRCGVGRSPKR